MFGQTLIGGYPAILEEQMYAVIFTALLIGRGLDTFTVDRILEGRRERSHDTNLK